jgi:hypothetical protein
MTPLLYSNLPYFTTCDLDLVKQNGDKYTRNISHNSDWSFLKHDNIDLPPSTATLKNEWLHKVRPIATSETDPSIRSGVLGPGRFTPGNASVTGRVFLPWIGEEVLIISAATTGLVPEPPNLD